MNRTIVTEERAFIAPDVIMRILNGANMEELIRQTHVRLVTSDFALYEAITSMEKNEINNSILSDFLLKVTIVPSPKMHINMTRVTSLRERAGMEKKVKRWKK